MEDFGTVIAVSAVIIGAALILTIVSAERGIQMGYERIASGAYECIINEKAIEPEYFCSKVKASE